MYYKAFFHKKNRFWGMHILKYVLDIFTMTLNWVQLF